MATLKIALKLLSYSDVVSSNDPDEVLHDLEREFIDEGITEVDSKFIKILRSTVDQEINFELTDIKYLFLQNRSSLLHVTYKINGSGNQEQFLGPDGFMFNVAADSNNDGQITSLHVSNPDANTDITLRIFAAK